MRRVQRWFVGALVGALAICGVGIASPHVAPAACVGDCNGSGDVTVGEIILMVNIALGTARWRAAAPGIADGSGDITINEIVAAVNNDTQRVSADGHTDADSHAQRLRRPRPSRRRRPRHLHRRRATRRPSRRRRPTRRRSRPLLQSRPLRPSRPLQRSRPRLAYWAPAISCSTRRTSTLPGEDQHGADDSRGQFPRTDPTANPRRHSWISKPASLTSTASRRINITAASEFFYVDATALAGFVVCIKPLVPVPSGGHTGLQRRHGRRHSHWTRTIISGRSVSMASLPSNVRQCKGTSRPRLLPAAPAT